MERIWENERNGKPYWVLRINGERYTVWNPKLLEGIQEGSLVAYEFKRSGNYRHITRLIPVPEPGETGAGSAGLYLNERDARMVRMSALRSAAQLIYTIEMRWEEKVESTLQLAREFERYIMGQLPPGQTDKRAPAPSPGVAQGRQGFPQSPPPSPRPPDRK